MWGSRGITGIRVVEDTTVNFTTILQTNSSRCCSCPGVLPAPRSACAARTQAPRGSSRALCARMCLLCAAACHGAVGARCRDIINNRTTTRISRYTAQTSPRPTTHAAASGHLHQCTRWLVGGGRPTHRKAGAAMRRNGTKRGAVSGAAHVACSWRAAGTVLCSRERPERKVRAAAPKEPKEPKVETTQMGHQA